MIVARISEKLDVAIQEEDKKKVASFYQFAQLYDTALGKLIKREDFNAGLTGILKGKLDEARKAKDAAAVEEARNQATELLAAAEEELSKEASFNPIALLQAIDKLKPSWEKGQSDELRARLFKVFSTIDVRVIQAFDKALDDSEQDKVVNLLKFAGTYDKTRNALQMAGVEDDTPDIDVLTNTLKGFGAITKHLKIAQQELEKDKPNFEGVIESLKDLLEKVEPMWKRDGISDELRARLLMVSSIIDDHVIQAFDKALDASEQDKVVKLLKFSGTYDTTRKGLPEMNAQFVVGASSATSEGGQASALTNTLKGHGAIAKHLKIAEQELDKEKPNIEVVIESLKELLEKVKPMWERDGISAEAAARLLKVKNSTKEQSRKAFKESADAGDTAACAQIKETAKSFQDAFLKLTAFELLDEEMKKSLRDESIADLETE